MAVLGKLIEECNELAARAARCVIHGLDETDPDTGRLNADELTREVANVLACLDIAEQELILSIPRPRVLGKLNSFRFWHQLIREGRRDG